MNEQRLKRVYTTPEVKVLMIESEDIMLGSNETPFEPFDLCDEQE